MLAKYEAVGLRICAGVLLLVAVCQWRAAAALAQRLGAAEGAATQARAELEYVGGCLAALSWSVSPAAMEEVLARDAGADIPSQRRDAIRWALSHHCAP